MEIEAERPGFLTEMRKKNIRPNGGETRKEFYERAQKWLNDMSEKYGPTAKLSDNKRSQNEVILVVTHGGVIEMLFHSILSGQFDAERKFRVKNSAINVIQDTNSPFNPGFCIWRLGDDGYDFFENTSTMVRKHDNLYVKTLGMFLGGVLMGFLGAKYVGTKYFTS